MIAYGKLSKDLELYGDAKNIIGLECSCVVRRLLIACCTRMTV